MRNIIFILIQIFLFGCSKNSNSEMEIMKTTGSYKIGATRYYFTDDKRPETFTEKSDDHREIAIIIWYPTEDITELVKAPYIEKAKERKKLLLKKSPLPPYFFEKIAKVKSNSFYNAKISDNEEKYPIILFSHGYNAGMSANSILMEELASYGYITISVGYAYETSHFINGDGSVKIFSCDNNELIERSVERRNTLTLQSKLNDTSDDEELRFIIREIMDKRPKIMESLNIWVEDTSFIIDKLEELNMSDELFKGKLDLDKIGVIGHSFGGSVAGQMCITDSRCKAGVNLDGLQIGDMLDKPLEKPFMFMHHDKENVINIKLNKPFFNQSVNDAYLLVIKGTTHFNLSDLSLPLYSKLLNPPKEMLGSIDGFRCLKIQNDYIRAFFDKYLSNRKSILLEKESTDFPEVEISINLK